MRELTPAHLLYQGAKILFYCSNIVGGVARCRLCQSLIRQKNANTTNLWSHLKSNHPELYPPPIASAAAAAVVAEQQQMQGDL